MNTAMFIKERKVSQATSDTPANQAMQVYQDYPVDPVYQNIKSSEIQAYQAKKALLEIEANQVCQAHSVCQAVKVNKAKLAT